MSYERQMTDEELSQVIDGKILEQMEREPMALRDRLRLQKELFDSFRRLDILQELVDDPGITEIMVNGPEEVFVETEGRIRRWEKSFESREQLLELIRQIVSRVNRTVNTASPIADARLAGRFEGPCGAGAGGTKRTDPDDPEISRIRSPWTGSGIREHHKGGGGSFKDAGGGPLQHFCQRRHGGGKDDIFKCSFGVYPSRRAGDHHRGFGGTSDPGIENLVRMEDQKANAEGGSHRDRGSDQERLCE